MRTVQWIALLCMWVDRPYSCHAGWNSEPNWPGTGHLTVKLVAGS